MTRLPPAYPHQVVSDWIAANDVHVLTDSVEKKLIDVTWDDYSSLLDYDVSTGRARKMQANVIAAISRTIGKAIGRIVSNTISSLGGHWRTRRQIERIPRLSPRLLDDAGIPHEIQGRIRARQSHSQTHRFFLYL